MKGFCFAILIATAGAIVTASPAHATRVGPPSIARSEPASDAPSETADPRLHDPQKELNQLSKNLRLTRDQRVGVDSILQERAREMRLLFDVESLSQEYRDTLAARVMEESNAQIESVLGSKQKIKFEKELAKDRGIHEQHSYSY